MPSPHRFRVTTSKYWIANEPSFAKALELVAHSAAQFPGETMTIWDSGARIGRPCIWTIAPGQAPVQAGFKNAGSWGPTR